MKIGILTVHRAINVGAVLQTYALQELLRSLGHEVWVINYLQKEVEASNRPVLSFSKMIDLLIHGHLRSVYYYPQSIKSNRLKQRNFDSFLSDYLNCSPLCDSDSIPQDFEAYVIGSDQVWNWNIFHRQDPVFWGNFSKLPGAKLVSYAASTSIQSLKKTDHDFVEESLNHFSLLSVRENPVAQFMNDEYKLLHTIETHIDPTLAASPTIWDTFKSDFVPNEPYIFVYAARTYLPNPLLIKRRAEELGCLMNCKVVYMSYRHHSPVDYVALIRNAKAVVTSSFHGVAFSIIFNRSLFALLYGDEQDYRYKNLLESLGASNCLFDIEKTLKPYTPDYRVINDHLKIEREAALNYLKKI